MTSVRRFMSSTLLLLLVVVVVLVVGFVETVHTHTGDYALSTR